MPERIPASCPARAVQYTVVPGDTMYQLSLRNRIPLETLIAANPHIENPAIIFPGDVLCIPAPWQMPEVITFEPEIGLPSWVWGIGYRAIGQEGRDTLTLVATLPEPRELGYARYLTYLQIRSGNLVDTWGGVEMYRTPQNPSTWVFRYDFLPTRPADEIIVYIGAAQEGQYPPPPPGERVVLTGYLRRTQ